MENIVFSESSVSNDEVSLSTTTLVNYEIEDSCKMYVPNLEPGRPTIDLEKFNALHQITHLCKNVDSDENDENKTLLNDALNESFSVGKDNQLQAQAIHKYLLTAQNIYFSLTKDPILVKIASLHEKLFLLSEKIEREVNVYGNLDLCSILLGDTFDLYSSTVSQICKNEYWNQGKEAEEVISSFVSKELMNLRLFDGNNLKILSNALIRRCMEHAPESDKKALIAFAEKENISISKF